MQTAISVSGWTVRSSLRSSPAVMGEYQQYHRLQFPVSADRARDRPKSDERMTRLVTRCSDQISSPRPLRGAHDRTSGDRFNAPRSGARIVGQAGDLRVAQDLL